MNALYKLGLFGSLLGGLAGGIGCKKYLTAKPDSNQQLPQSVSVIAGMLNNTALLQEQDPSLLDKVTDEYYVPDDRWPQIDPEDRAAYIWQGNMYPQDRAHEWGMLYQRVFIANVALAGLDKLDPPAGQEEEYKFTKGLAYFVRARAFQQAAFLWAPAYEMNSGWAEKGIPLRLTDDVNEKITRSTVEQTYRQIIRDFSAAAELLPQQFSHAQKVSAPAANAYLARTFLAMHKYDTCLMYARRVLGKYANFFHLAASNSPFINEYPSLLAFNRFNPEVLFDATANYASITGFGGGVVDSTLYSTYSTNDLRRKYYYSSTGDFTGDYSGSFQTFTGIGTDEVFLMEAECLVRLGRVAEGMDRLNGFLSVKFDNGQIDPYPDFDPYEALDIVLAERKKQLVRRGVRWMDLKRLNKEGYIYWLKRVVKGETFQLSPNSPKYALPIPEDVIKMTGIEQN
jgi:starch-binding outer membrane protein, SusD/RagB family